MLCLCKYFDSCFDSFVCVRHKTYPPLPIKANSEWDWGEWESDITTATKNAVASPRVTTLADPKKAHPHYEPCR